jgi:general secretion pathway protein B
MSFILDALKKSEIERQRQATPGLIDAGVASRRPRMTVWAIALGALLGVNLAVLVYVVTRSGPAAVPATQHANAAPLAAAAPAAAPAPVAASAAAMDHFSPLDAPVYAPEIPIAPEEGAAESSSKASHSPVASTATPAAHAMHRPELPPADPDGKSDNDEVLPSISEVNLTGPLALPELHLDVHVYATKPSDRFVYINMRKYHEGAALEEGPTIERIRRDGVILNFQGVRFILPRAEGQGDSPPR